MAVHHRSAFGWLVLIAAGLLLQACDESPNAPQVPDRLRVALVTSTDGERWYVYEIDQEGTVELVLDSTEPVQEARYSSVRGTRGAVAYQYDSGELRIYDLASGDDAAVQGTFTRPRFSADGSLITYTALVTDQDSVGAEQVFVFDRDQNASVQVTENECAAENPPDPCAFSSSRPLFGEDDVLYLVRSLRTGAGDEWTAVSRVSSSLIEQRYFTVPAAERSILPNSVFEGTLVAPYAEQQGTPDEVLGFYAISVQTGEWLENQVQMRHASFCFDATILGVAGTELRVVDIAGTEVDRISLPAAYGDMVLSVTCSVQSKDLVR